MFAANALEGAGHDANGARHLHEYAHPQYPRPALNAPNPPRWRVWLVH